MLRALIFDVDGTLADTAPAADSGPTTSTVKLCAAIGVYTASPASPSTTVCRIFGRSPAFHSATSWRTR